MESGSNKIYRNGKPGWFWPLLLLLLVIGWLTFYLKCCNGIYGGSAEACVKKCCKDGAKTEANHVGDAEEHAEVTSASSAGELDANGNFIINTGSHQNCPKRFGLVKTVLES